MGDPENRVVEGNFKALAEKNLENFQRLKLLNKGNVPAFFAIVDFSYCQTGFQIMELNSAPHVIYFPPQTPEDKGSSDKTLITLPENIVLQPAAFSQEVVKILALQVSILYQ